ncbi:hypothetical protein AMATHDRAFT_71563 [Amanita thiersii Skay4041]|uniref:RRM Nup35-type domain-containing protein n=1 Tax=Amanita thiersii Skay4041 TaxID=703135 RepID=A0A2A9NCQ3_9AGAR|nr:hypothetical protein AMATHDRAFT_71563 [Amanita thiersii Skay4041]
MHSSFTVAGMSTSGGAHHHHHHNPNLSTWGSTAGNPSSLSTSFSDSLSASRSHYQPGYLMSASQHSNPQQGSPRMDDAPIVQTKAKMNQGLVRPSEFGIDSMFESSRKRQTFADEDAPPTSSVNDIPNETYVDTTPGFQPKTSALGMPSLFQSRQQHRPQSSLAIAGTSGTPQHHHHNSSSHNHHQPIHIIVFGYPPDRYSVTVEYFQSLGDATEPTLNTEIINCFRIGYHDPGDAMRAVRKNGEILGGSWMIGVKWADPAQAEALFGNQASLLSRSANALPESSSNQPTAGTMAVDPPMTPIHHPQPHFGMHTPGATTPSVGTPIRLAPSTAAFKKSTIGGGGGASGAKAPQQQPQASSSLSNWSTAIPGGLGGTSGSSAGGVGSAWGSVAGVAPVDGNRGSGAVNRPNSSVQSKGVFGQVSDLIFGW